MENKRKEELRLEIELDELHVPEKITWFSSDGGSSRLARAVLMSVWDEKESSTYKIDLWTKDMTVEEMKKFFHQTILTLSETFERSTGESAVAAQMKDFGAWFAEQMKIDYKKPPESQP